MRDEIWNRFQHRLDLMLIPYQGQVAYGNLRREISEWGGGDSRTSNVAIIYETPGGSTNQINVTYHHQTGHFTVLDPASHGERDISDLGELFQVLDRYVTEIPERRGQMLQTHIRAWHEDGLSRQQSLQSLRQFLRPMDLKGGSITEDELARAARFTVRLYAGQA